MKNRISNGIIVILFTIIPALLPAQTSAWPKLFSGEDSAAVSALVLYPDSLRLSIFEACKYPEAIVRITHLQQTTSSAFANLLSGYSRQQQEDLWDLTRYPDLVHQLAVSQSGSMENIAEQYPPEIQDKIRQYAVGYTSVFHQMDDLYNTSAQQFSDLLKGYAPSAIHAFNDLVAMPEVLNILNDHLQMTVLVGDLYKKDPAGLIHTADSLNLVLVQQNAINTEAWKKSITDDPAAAADLKATAEEYAQENGYTADDYSTAPSQYYVEHYVCYSYPYWFGYPYWYPYYYWYPYPWWYDWGFYIDPFGNMVFIGTPSYYFTYWYFYYPHHYYHHPYLANVYVSYYYGPRHTMDGNSNVVHEWVAGNREYLSQDFVTNVSGRPNMIRDLGKFETDLQQHNAVNPAAVESRDQFISDHKKDYPSLNAPDADQIKQEQAAPQWYEAPKTPPVKQPPVKVKDQQKNDTGQPQKESPKYDFKKVDKAQQYHKSVWGNETPSRQQPTPPNTGTKNKKIH